MWQLPDLSPEEILMYLRKSRTDDPALTVEEVLSKHEQMLGDWVARTLPGRQIPEENRYREVVSGETIDSRPRVQELLRRVESPRIKAVLIVEPQRLSRGDLEDIGRMVKLLRYTNTLVITLQYTYDLSDERDRDMFERELKRGNEFLEYQKRIMGNGRLLSVQNGNFIGQSPPYGYRKAIIKEGKRKCHTLEPEPEEAKIVKLIFEMYAGGTNAHQIARTLNGMAIPSPLGKSWSAASVKPIVTNDHYIGMVHWNRRKTVKIIEDGELVATRPRSHDYLSYPGKHPAIIDRDLWDAAQAIRGLLPPVKSRARYVNPFSGLVYCQCGNAMSRRQYTRPDGTERCAPRLLCNNQTKCHTASCTMDEMTEEIEKILKNAIANVDLQIAQGTSSEADLQRQIVSQLEKRLDGLNRQELSLWDKYTQEAMPKHIFDTLKEKLLRDKAEAEESLRRARESVPNQESYIRKRNTLYAALELLQNPNPPIRELNLLLKQCIERITYSRAAKQSHNRRFGLPEPIELDVTLRI